MKREQLERLTREQLIAISVKQDEAITEIRGYRSGLDAEKFGILDSKTLIDCFLENEKNFELNTTLKEETTMMKEFTLNGTLYKTNEKGNYFYKSTGTTDKQGNPFMMRIPKHVFDKALAEYTEEAKKWEAQANAEYETRKAEQDKEQAESDRAAEDAMNKCGDGTPYREVGKQIMKQAKKTRRSKDVAYEGHGVTLTAKQVDFLQRVAEIDFEANNYETGLEHTMWCDVLVDMIGGQFLDKPMAVGAMVSTLREKGVITVGVDRINGKKCKYFEYTDNGNAIIRDLM